MSDELQDRITELEIRFSYQAEQLDELNGVVIECNQRIDRLGRDNLQLREMISHMSPELEESPDE